MKFWFVCAVLALAVLMTTAVAQPGDQLRLPLLYSDGAVLQRGQPLRIWGNDVPGARVHVRFDGEHVAVTTNAQGHWQATLPAHAAGGPYTLDIDDGQRHRRIENVMVGDVWLCSGQSNMEFTVSEASHARAEQAWANDPAIRQFKVPRTASSTPLKRLRGGSWVAAGAQTVGKFSAVCWYFARKMQRRTGVAQGLINSTWGGSTIEAWTDAETAGVNLKSVAATRQSNQDTEKAKMAVTRKHLVRWPNVLKDAAAVTATPAWARVDADLSSWTHIAVPADWETQGYYDMDGVAWYRTEFTLTAAQAGQGVVLGLGKIDDSDRSYVNGQLIGHTERLWNRKRAYKVAPEVLRAGRNTLAVRVEDLAAGGGIHGAADNLYVQFADGQRRSLAGSWHFRPTAVQLVASNKPQHVPTLLYNGMIHPFQGYRLRAIIWYQGANNALPGRARAYADQFKALIRSRRAQWQRPDLPFIWVQLANYDARVDTATSSPWAELRASQSAALSLPHTGQVVTIDLGSSGTVHPLNKQDVGYRLALVASRLIFGDDIVDAGPVFDSVKVDGKQLIMSFHTQGASLAVREGGQVVHGIEVAGADGHYYPARARIQGATVVASSSEVTHPVAVRYAWSEDPVQANLINRDGLPAAPFRARVP